MMETLPVERQKLDPLNPLIAHDTGLFHYWRAKNETDPEKAAAHWQRVIGNWVPVLENNDYWNQWCRERQEVYGKTITDDHIAGVRQQLKEHIILQLAENAKNSPDPAAVHLECEFFLEAKAFRLVKQRGGFYLTARQIQRLVCGPLLARQSGIFSHQDNPFPASYQTLTDKRRLLQNILAPLKLDNQQDAVVKYADMDRQLRLCFSQLGVPYIYLERGEPQRAINALAEPGRSSDLETFPLLNPAYNFGPVGKQLFKQHAVQLNISARIAIAQQVILEDPADIPSLVNHVREALELSRAIDIHEDLAQKAAQLMLSWADRLSREERWDQAIELTRSAGEFEKGEQWKGKLAGMLNARGVKKAEKEQWQQSVDDLEQAHELNPAVPLFRENLINALKSFKNSTYDKELRQKITNRIEELQKKPERKQEKEPEVIKIRELLFSPRERYNTNLFDSKGVLNWKAFDNTGQTVISGALEEAAVRKNVLIDIPVIAAALTRCKNSETLRLLKLQGTGPEILCFHTSGDNGKYPGTQPLDYTSTLTQFNLTRETLGALQLACENAQSDHRSIGETHILYALLHNPGVANQLKQAGTDMEQMRRQLSHNKTGD
jgi:tetratricopeptide (TPR) repeat protein